MSLKVATILFTYHRSRHTKAVLDGLRENYILPEKLFIFQDGVKASTNEEEWVKVNNLIKEVSFCPTEVIVSTQNKGLAQSVVDGVNRVFEDYDAVIVLEDDCVPSRNFINFMVQCLERYRDEKKVHSASGFAWPLKMGINESDVYFTGRVSSWGWGTWKDRWEKYNQSPQIVKTIMQNPELSMQLALWGKDLPQIMLSKIEGKNDSWAIYWALNAIEKKGLCISPNESLIQNIGFDGTGVHCGTKNDYYVALEHCEKKTYSFPLRLKCINPICSDFFCHFCCSYIVNQVDISLEHIVVYGIGGYFLRREQFLARHFYVEAFIDRAWSGFYVGRPILQDAEIQSIGNKRIVIMLENPKECDVVNKRLQELFHINQSQIVYGLDLTD